MSQRISVLVGGVVVAAVVFVYDSTAARLVDAAANPTQTTVLAAFVSAGGVVLAGVLAAGAVWLVTTAMLPDEAFGASGTYTEVAAAMERRERQIVATAEEIARAASQPEPPGGDDS